MSRRCLGACGRDLTDPESIRVGYGRICAAKAGIPHAANTTHHTTSVPATAGQLPLEDTVTDLKFTVNLPSGPAEASITIPGSAHTVPDSRGCPDCGEPAYFSGCDADGCNGYGCQDCGSGCDLDFADDGRCATA
ncbi:DUF6011 domain-containing protein [Streptomyces sp. DSM 42041]|uniref:DUF6011 domain-containing protein n=1 Tax=Streptomyces hazeniae TaxID=3075538 RepID=A0ABU2NXZ6_9ACTN|nr:DUF6011 domain-containing protein [Streptomyces sp. DSM 42041]MDT0381397.1 DUF6011 domain-containing protein [Streptomyces sp. DSM 42041]